MIAAIGQEREAAFAEAAQAAEQAVASAVTGGVGLARTTPTRRVSTPSSRSPREYEPDPRGIGICDELFGVYRDLRAASTASWDRLQAAMRKAAVA